MFEEVTPVRPIICYSKRLLKIENKMIPKKDSNENKIDVSRKYQSNYVGTSPEILLIDPRISV